MGTARGAEGRGPAGVGGEETAALDWLALYVPTWGTSVVLHVAVMVLAAFMMWQPPADGTPRVIPVGIYVPKPPPQVERRDTPLETSEERPEEGSDHWRPEPADFSRTLDMPPTPMTFTPDVVIRLWDGKGPRIPALADGRPGRPGVPDIFPPPSEEARKIVYVVDRSGSMTDSLDLVKLELARAIRELPEEKEFHVIFYSDGPPLEMPTRRLVNATERNKRLALEFIDGVIARSETDPSEALARAFAVRPDAIYLLTDGEFDRAVVGLVRRLRGERQVAVHTIGFLYTPPGSVAEAILKEIADQNGGEYKFVSEQDLGSLVP